MPKKRTVRRTLRPVFYIFCEGEKTEPYYLEHYILRHCSGLRSVQINRIKWSDVVKIPKTNRTDPNSLVNLAIKQKSKSPSPDQDQYWCVYDREAENVVHKSIHIKAFKVAAENEIEVAFSNVCFEIWLLLHKQKGCAPYISCNDLVKRSQLLRYFPGYKKGCRREFDGDDIANARKQAVIMNAHTCNVTVKELPDKIEPSRLVDLNPYTDFYKLLDAIDMFLTCLK